MKCVLVNPWIYDFAALNLWARPLGLIRVAEHMSRYDTDIAFIDCTDVYGKRKRFGAGKYPREIIEKPSVLKAVPRSYARYGISIEEFSDRLKKCLPCDLVLVTSVMSYWYPGVQKAIEIIKSLAPDTPVVLGGIYATLYHRHASENSGADHVFSGHIGSAISGSSMLKAELNGSGSSGLETVMKKFGLCPAGVREPEPYYRLGLYQSYPFAPILTGSGCPYKCSYCASSVLFNGYVRQDPRRVLDEIMALYKTGVRDFAFYDDALLVDADVYLKVVLRKIISSGISARFHCPNGIHARFIDEELARLMKRSGFTTIRLGLETVSGQRQKDTGGKVTSDVLASAVKELKTQGFTKAQTGVYLMYGLPGQGLEEVNEGIRFIKGLGARVHLTEFSPIPFTECWEELISMGIMSNDIDPLLTNNSVFSALYSGYDPEAVQRMKNDVKQYNCS